MKQFLVEIDPEEIYKANEPIPTPDHKMFEDKDDEEVTMAIDKLEETAAEEAYKRIQQIKVWSEIADNFTNEEKTDVAR